MSVMDQEGEVDHASPVYICKLINNDTPPTSNEMRRVATSGSPDQVRKEWRKFVADYYKPLLFAAD
jgi:hypothetical protein